MIATNAAGAVPEIETTHTAGPEQLTFSNVSGGGCTEYSAAAVSGTNFNAPGFYLQDNWSFSNMAKGGAVDGTEPRLDSWLRTLLINQMIAHKNTNMLQRMEWCRRTSLRQDTNLGILAYLNMKTLEQQSIGTIPRKVDDLLSWLTDLLIRSFSETFRIEATELPELSQDTRDEVQRILVARLTEVIQQRTAAAIQQVRAEYAQLGVAVTDDQAIGLAQERQIPLIPDEQVIREVAGEMVEAAKQEEKQAAEAGAKRMAEVVQDLLDKTGSMDELIKAIYDFCSQPFAVTVGGELKLVKRNVWRNRKIHSTRDWLPSIRRVSPWDFFWTPDSTDCHNGTGVGERIAMRRFDMVAFKKRSFAFPNRIDAVLNVYEGETRNWLSPSENINGEVHAWSEFPHETIDVFRIFTKVTGSKLRPYMRDIRLTGKKKIDMEQEYHIEAYITGKHMIGLRVHDGDFERPYNSVSYEESHSDFSGSALPEILAVIHAASRRNFRLMIRNMAKSTDPSTFLNKEMMQGALRPDETVAPGMQYDFQLPHSGYTGRPYYQLEHPNYAGQLLSFQQFLDERADIESGIPRYALGQASGLPSALRSIGALKLMMDSAMKTMTSRVYRMGRFMIAPNIEQMVSWVVASNLYPDVVVDAEVKVLGTEGAIRKVMVIDNIQATLQYLAPFAQTGLVNPAVVQSMVQDLLIEIGAGAADVAGATQELQGLAVQAGLPQNQLSAAQAAVPA